MASSYYFQFALILSVVAFSQPAIADDLGIKVPAGFEVSLYAGDELAHDIFSMTLDAKGRVVVAGLGYVKTLHDDNGDGQADRAALFSSVPKSGAHGLCFDGNDLICTGDESLLRLTDEDGDGIAEGEPQRLAKLRHPEHGANGVIRGPDGWYYIICGNDTGVTKDHITTANSPVLDPQSGVLLRVSPDGKRSEVVAHGLRNPYDLDFGPFGNVFTVDADGERDHHLPWYVPTRLFDLASGMHHGWMLQGFTRSWSRPKSFFDNVPPVAYLGRGSPTGLTVYRHRQFPAEYRNNVFSCCWTLGRIYRCQLKENADSFVSLPEVFLETTGEVGFAPVDVCVGKQGEMYVAIGGRRTRGSVFKITYRQPANITDDAATPVLTRILDAPQPLAAWSRGIWQPLLAQINRKLLLDEIEGKRPTEQRVRAVEILTEHFGGFKTLEANALIKVADPYVAARIAWSVSRTLPSKEAAGVLEQFADRKEDVVQRAAWAAMLELPKETLSSKKAWLDTPAGGTGRLGQYACLTTIVRQQWPLEPIDAAYNISFVDRNAHAAVAGTLTVERFPAVMQSYLLAAGNKPLNERELLKQIRLLQLALGDLNMQQQKLDVYAGYSANGDAGRIAAVAKPLFPALAATFPTPFAEANRELARLFAMLQIEDAALAERLIGQCNAETSPQDDLHYLICLSRLPGSRTTETTRQTAALITAVHGKMRAREQYASRNWPTRVGEMFAQCLERDPQLAATLLENPKFGEPEHALFALRLSTAEKQTAARKFWGDKSLIPADERGTPLMVELATSLPREEALPFVRAAAQHFGVREQALAYLAKEPRGEDRSLLATGLESPQMSTVTQVAKALVQLPPTAEDQAWIALLAALRQACLIPEATDQRASLRKLAEHWSSEKFEIEDKKGADAVKAYGPLFTWFDGKYPALAEKVRGLSGGDAAAWREKLTAISWDNGDAVRGKLVFEKRSCVRCHSGTGPLGPDLAGAATRFSREDLFTAILEPSKDVAPPYQTTQVVTGGGRIYHGLVVYESPDGTLLQTGPDTTVRVAGEEIVAMRKSKVSLMPSNLLNGATNEELADLYAYLRTMRLAK